MIYVDGRDSVIGCKTPSDAEREIDTVLFALKEHFSEVDFVEALARIKFHVDGKLRIALHDYEYKTGIVLDEAPEFKRCIWRERDLWG